MSSVDFFLNVKIYTRREENCFFRDAFKEADGQNFYVQYCETACKNVKL